jgi:hypothetical protein
MGALSKSPMIGVLPQNCDLSAHTLAVGRDEGKFETSRRREVVPFTHHREVAALPPADADRLLDC